MLTIGVFFCRIACLDLSADKVNSVKVSLIYWILDTRSQGCTDLQSLVHSMTHRDIYCGKACSHAKLCWADNMHWVKAAPHSEFQAIFLHATVILSSYADSK